MLGIVPLQPTLGFTWVSEVDGEPQTEMMLIRYKFVIRIHVREDFVLFISLFYIASAVAQTRQVINNLL